MEILTGRNKSFKIDSTLQYSIFVDWLVIIINKNRWSQIWLESLIFCFFPFKAELASGTSAHLLSGRTVLFFPPVSNKTNKTSEKAFSKSVYSREEQWETT